MKNKSNKIILLTSIIIGLIILGVCIFVGIKLYLNVLSKESGTLYIVIKQYVVEDERFKPGSEGVIIYKEKFTDDLYYHEKIVTKYGYNEVLIENGIARVIDADCLFPHIGSGCMNGIVTNKSSFLDKQIICCYKHGISISWEVSSNED